MHQSCDLKIKEAINHLWDVSEFMGWILRLDYVVLYLKEAVAALQT